MTPRNSLVALLACAILSLAACSRPYQVIEVPRYGADLYPTSHTRAGVTVAVDEIWKPRRVERHFGADLIEQDIFPVHVVVSNYGRQRVTVKPSDIMLYRWKEVLDPMPLERVVASAKKQHGSVASSADGKIEKFFENSAFREVVLLPNDTYGGIVYFALPPRKTAADKWFRPASAFPSAGPQLRLGLTNVDTGERVLFGPLTLAMPD